MALGLFSKAKDADQADRNSSTDEKYHSKPDHELATIGAGTNRLADPGANRDPEMGVDSESEASIIGKQLAMEADNAIKYRTCSWYKVRFEKLKCPAYR
jgi:hypothetical protein